MALPDNLKQTRWLVWGETKMVTNLTNLGTDPIAVKIYPKLEMGPRVCPFYDVVNPASQPGPFTQVTCQKLAQRNVLTDNDLLLRV